MSLVNNPGEWNQYTFRAKFCTKKQNNQGYLHHQLPTGARVVPPNSEQKRKFGDWNFEYKDWTQSSPNQFRDGATAENPFPNEQKGKLDYALLKRLGLTKTRIEDNDCLFFYQLIKVGY